MIRVKSARQPGASENPDSASGIDAPLCAVLLFARDGVQGITPWGNPMTKEDNDVQQG